MNKKTLRLALTVIVVAVAALAIRTWFAPKATSVSSSRRQLMGTFAQIIAEAPNTRTANACIEAAFDQLNRIDSMMSYQNVDSQLSALNRDAYEKPVKLSDDLFIVLTEAVKYSEKTDGAFDVTVGPLVDLWEKAGRDNNWRKAEQAILQMAKRI